MDYENCKHYLQMILRNARKTFLKNQNFREFLILTSRLFHLLMVDEIKEFLKKKSRFILARGILAAALVIYEQAFAEINLEI